MWIVILTPAGLVLLVVLVLLVRAMPILLAALVPLLVVAVIWLAWAKVVGPPIDSLAQNTIGWDIFETDKEREAAEEAYIEREEQSRQTRLQLEAKRQQNERDNAASWERATTPSISSVSPISDQLEQTIVIEGKGFGGDQKNCRRAPMPGAPNLRECTAICTSEYSPIKIHSRTRGWTITCETTLGLNANIVLASWEDNKITLAGFHGMLRAPGPELRVGDELEIIVSNTFELHKSAKVTVTVGK